MTTTITAENFRDELDAVTDGKRDLDARKRDLLAELAELERTEADLATREADLGKALAEKYLSVLPAILADDRLEIRVGTGEDPFGYEAEDVPVTLGVIDAWDDAVEVEVNAYHSDDEVEQRDLTGPRGHHDTVVFTVRVSTNQVDQHLSGGNG